MAETSATIVSRIRFISVSPESPNHQITRSPNHKITKSKSPGQLRYCAPLTRAPPGLAGARERERVIAGAFDRAPRSSIVLREVSAGRPDGDPRRLGTGHLGDGGAEPAQSLDS